MNQAKQNMLRQARAALAQVRSAQCELRTVEIQLEGACAQLQWDTCDYGRIATRGQLEECEKASRSCIRLDAMVMQAYLGTNPIQE